MSGRALEWYADLKRDGRVPERLKDLKKLMARKFYKDQSEVFAMKGNDIRSYIRGLDRIFAMASEIFNNARKEMFIDGLSPSLLSVVANQTGSYAKLKMFASEVAERIDERETHTVFGAYAVHRPRDRRPGQQSGSVEERKEQRTCYRCEKMGHLKRSCPQSLSEQVKAGVGDY